MACMFLAGAFSLFYGSSSRAAASGTWPQWRGPQRTGVVEAAPWPAKLGESVLQPVWRQEIGHGYSGPIVSEHHVFTVETRDKKKEIVRAFDRVTGEQVWETAWDGA